MEKSPINILQEHCIKAYIKYPTYSVRDTSQNGQIPLFTVDCIVENTKTSGIASSKSAAKADAAEQMITKLNIIDGTQISTISSKPAKNYVGLLNEYCSKKYILYPQYMEDYADGAFVTSCKHEELLTTGKGSNKKIAKQESAKTMLQLLKYPLTQPSINKLSVNNVSSATPTVTVVKSPSSPVPSAQKALSPSKAFLPPNNQDSVSIFNMYCDKHGYKKPEYFDIGKIDDKFATKCCYQEFVTKGTGLTMKIAKQDAAKQMLKLLKCDGGTLTCKAITADVVDNLIDLSPSTPCFKQELPDDDTIIDLYKKKSLSNLVDNLLPAFNNLLPLGDDSEMVLRENKVQYNFEVLQNSDPCIVTLKCTKLMSNGEKMVHNFMEMGTSTKEIEGALLKRAAAAFDC